MVRSLSFHATYACRHSGACCTADWPIPIEADRLVRLQSALASGLLRAVSDGSTPLVATHSWPNASLAHEFRSDTPAVLGRHGHACVFFDEDGGRLCRIHSALGHHALPLACRQF